MPPEFGKEVDVKLLKLLICFVLLPTVVFSIQINVNGSSWKTWDDSLQQFANESSYGKIIPMSDVVPILVQEADTLRVTAANGILEAVDPNSNLILKEGEWLLEGHETLGEILSVEIEGEILDSHSIEIWLDWEGISALKSIIARFGELHQIEISVQEVPKAASKLRAIVRAGGRVPDIVMVSSSDICDLVWEDAIQPLDYINPINLSGRNSFTYNERLWAIPFYADTQLALFNRKVVENIDRNWTLEEFESISQNLGELAAGWNIYSAYWFIPFQLGFGKSSLIEDGELIITDQPTISALAYLVDKVSDGTFRALERDAMVSLFAAGKTGVILSGSYMIPQLEEIDLDYGIAPFPFPLRPLLDYKGFSIAKKTRSPILARQIIEHLTSVKIQQVFCENTYKIPANQSALRIIDLPEDMKRSMENGYPIPCSPLYGLYKNTMWKLLNLALSGKMEVEAVLESGQEIIYENYGGME